MLFVVNFRLFLFDCEKSFSSRFIFSPDRFVSDCVNIDKQSIDARMSENPLKTADLSILESPFLLLFFSLSFPAVSSCDPGQGCARAFPGKLLVSKIFLRVFP